MRSITKRPKNGAEVTTSNPVAPSHFWSRQPYITVWTSDAPTRDVGDAAWKGRAVLSHKVVEVELERHAAIDQLNTVVRTTACRGDHLLVSSLARSRSMLLYVVKDQFWRRCGQTSDEPLGFEGGLYQARRCRVGW